MVILNKLSPEQVIHMVTMAIKTPKISDFGGDYYADWLIG